MALSDFLSQLTQPQMPTDPGMGISALLNPSLMTAPLPSSITNVTAAAPPAQTQAAQPQVTQTATGRPNGWKVLGATLRDLGANFRGQQGNALSTLEQSTEADQTAAAQRVQMAALAKALNPDDPVAQMAFLADPKSAIAAYYKNQEAYTLGEGGARMQGSKQVAYNPKIQIANDHVIASNGQGGVTVGQALPMGYAEQQAAANAAETARHNKVDEQHQANQEDIARSGQAVTMRGQNMTAASSAASTGVARAHLGLDQSKFGFEQTQAAIKNHPDAVPITNAADYAKLPKGTKYIPPGSMLAKIKQ